MAALAIMSRQLIDFSVIPNFVALRNPSPTVIAATLPSLVGL
jgi:hypothetical protein